VPELPEAETTRRGIEPHVTDRRITRVKVRQPDLRWPVPTDLAKRLAGGRVVSLGRRGKYLLLNTTRGTLILHLGMSGSLRIVDEDSLPGPHDHVDIGFSGGKLLRLRDPRRFGAVLWGGDDPATHPLLRDLGPEPLEDHRLGATLWQASRGRQVAVKNFLMNSRVVAGVGNIYASEALFAAGIHPSRAAGRIGESRYDLLAEALRSVLSEAIEAGGTTLRDFVREDGRPGYFRISLKVYGRAGEPCTGCGGAIRLLRLGQRSSFYCPACQH